MNKFNPITAMLISYNEALAPVESCATIRSTGVSTWRVTGYGNARNEIGVNFASPLSGCRACLSTSRFGWVRNSRRKNSLALVSIQSFPSPLLSTIPSNASTMKSFEISVLPKARGGKVKLGIGTGLTAPRCESNWSVARSRNIW